MRAASSSLSTGAGREWAKALCCWYWRKALCCSLWQPAQLSLPTNPAVTGGAGRAGVGTWGVGAGAAGGPEGCWLISRPTTAASSNTTASANQRQRLRGAFLVTAMFRSSYCRGRDAAPGYRVIGDFKARSRQKQRCAAREIFPTLPHFVG